MFSAATRNNSISLLKFPFLSHVQIFPPETLLVRCLKYLYSCFFPDSVFLIIVVPLILMLSVLFLIAVICLSLLFLCITFKSSYWCIHAVFDADGSSSSLFSWHILSMLSLGCKALRIIISFLVFLPTMWNSFLVHFKNGPEYLTRGTVHVFISFIWFLK